MNRILPQPVVPMDGKTAVVALSGTHIAQLVRGGYHWFWMAVWACWLPVGVA